MEAPKVRFFIYYLPLVGWMLMIFIASSIPANRYPSVEWWGWSKIIHILFYSVLCFLLMRAFRVQETSVWLRSNAALGAIVIALLYGASDEFHQMFTPGRHPQVTDVMIDVFGACLFLAGHSLYHVTRFALAKERVRS